MGMAYGRGNVGYGLPQPLTLRNDRHGLYRYDPTAEWANLRQKKPYSFWSSAKYIFVLSLMLWWIPTFGQMIAGYVGGRKAGNHWKAVGAALFPVALIWILSLTVEATASFPALANLFGLPAAAAYGLGHAIPLIDPYIRFLVDYFVAFASALKQTVGMGVNGYLVTIIFAYIGGLLAVQSRQEAKGEEEAEGLPPFEMPYPILEAPQRRAPASFAPASFAPVRAGWYRGHRESYAGMRRIPAAPPAYGEPPPYYDERPPYYEPPPAPVQQRLEDAYDLGEAYGPEPEAPPSRPQRTAPAPRGRLKRLDREELIRRLVERALREYDRSVR